MSEEKNQFGAMDETIEMLEGRVLDCLDSSDISAIIKKFEGLTGPTIIMGSGGSSVSARFVASVLEEQNGIICESKIPDEVWHMNLRPYKNIVAVSGSGKNAGVSKAVDYAAGFGVETQLLTPAKDADKDKDIVYGISEKKEDSFISFANTIMPMALALCYHVYCEMKKKNPEVTPEEAREQAKAIIKDMFENGRKSPVEVKDGQVYEIVGKESYPTAAAFVESCLSESSIAVPVTSGRYDECHGRTTSMLQQRDRQMIYFQDQQSELDSFMHERLTDSGAGDRITDVNSGYEDLILGDFYLTVVMAHWCCDLAKTKGVDLTRMSDAEGRRLHIKADDRAIARWEETHGRGFWEGRPDWAGLTDVGDGERGPGYYAPTGKFFAGDLGSTGRKPSKDNKE